MENEQNSDKENQNVSPVRTYKEDVASYIKKEGKSIADIAIAEESNREKRLEQEKTRTAIRESSKKLLKKITIVIIVTLLIISIGFLLKNYLQPKLPENYETTSLPISIENGAVVSDTENNIGQFAFKTLENQPGPIAIFMIDENGKLISLEKIFVSEKIYPPGELMRSLGQNYALGKALGGLFIISDISYYSNTTSGMIKWEKDIKKDLFNLLGLKSEIPIRTASSTSSAQEIAGRFNDEVISNQDARIFTEKSGSENLSYAIFNQKYLIIASTPDTLQSILSNLSPR